MALPGKRTGESEKMMRCFMVFMLMLLFCGCSGTGGLSESGKLSGEEEKAVVSHIRTFLRRSKIKLKPAERAYVMTHDPVFNVSYTGWKEGSLTVRWSFPHQRSLVVTRTGMLLSNGKADWTVRITTDKSTQLVPQNFYGAHGEELALPPL